MKINIIDMPNYLKQELRIAVKKLEQAREKLARIKKEAPEARYERITAAAYDRAVKARDAHQARATLIMAERLRQLRADKNHNYTA